MELKFPKNKLFSSPKIGRSLRISVDPLDSENLSDWEDPESDGGAWGESFDSDDDSATSSQRVEAGPGASPSKLKEGGLQKRHFRLDKDDFLRKFHRRSQRKARGEGNPQQGGMEVDKSPSSSANASPKGSPKLPRGLAKNVEGARDALRKKVSETARVWSATAGVSNLISGNQHQRLMGANGEDQLSPTSSQMAYQSSPTLMERSRDKGANLFGGNESRYQRLDNSSSTRKDSWGDGWGADWGSSDKDLFTTKDREEKLSSPKEQTRQNAARMSLKASSKDKKCDGSSLLLDFDSPESPAAKEVSSKSGPGTVHTWDNWDDDGWEKIE